MVKSNPGLARVKRDLTVIYCSGAGVILHLIDLRLVPVPDIGVQFAKWLH